MDFFEISEFSQELIDYKTYLSLGSVSLDFGTWRARCSKFPRAARVANCFRGARAPVDFLAVVFVLAIFLKRFTALNLLDIFWFYFNSQFSVTVLIVSRRMTKKRVIIWHWTWNGSWRLAHFEHCSMTNLLLARFFTTVKKNSSVGFLLKGRKDRFWILGFVRRISDPGSGHGSREPVDRSVVTLFVFYGCNIFISFKQNYFFDFPLIVFLSMFF